MIIGVLRGCDIVGLLLGSIESIDEISYLISGENLVGTGLNFPLTILRAKKCNESALKGGFKAHNSYKITPKLHISVAKE